MALLSVLPFTLRTPRVLELPCKMLTRLCEHPVFSKTPMHVSFLVSKKLG